MFQHLFSRTDFFCSFYKISHIIDIPHNDHLQMYKKDHSNLCIINSTFNTFHSRILQKTQNCLINKYFFQNFPKLLINNHHINPHQQRPKNLQQHQQIIKQKSPNHQHASLFKTIHTHVKKDTNDCPNH